jgi:WD40 repeat protein
VVKANEPVTGSENLQRYADLLHGRVAPAELPTDWQQELLIRGVIAALEESIARPESETGTETVHSAAALLREAAAGHASEAVRDQAFHALTRLAKEGSTAAVDSLYRLSAEADHLAARQVILTQGWQPGKPALRALLDWFVLLPTDRPYPTEQIPLLTQAFLEEASPALRRRILYTAAQNKMENWSKIVSAVQAVEDSHEDQRPLQPLVDRYPSFTAAERQVTLDLLARLAERGSQAATDTICQLFIRHEDRQARDLALARGYYPPDPEQQALFYFLSSEWEAYQNLDFNNNLLINAYEAAGRSLRRRMLEHSRHSGQMDWLRGIGSSGEIRWINDLTDADWELAMRRLLEDQRYPDLWRLAQAAPPVWSAAILDQLARRGWSPSTEADQSGFQMLAHLAQASLTGPMKVQAKQALYVPAAELISLIMHPDGRALAAGSSDQRIFLWKLPEGTLNESPVIGPAPVTRALSFSPDGEMLASASNDNRIRVFRLKNGQMIKTLEGHNATVRSLTIHADGRTLYSAGFDGSIRFWRFPYGPELRKLQPGLGEIFSMAVGSGGSHLITAGADCLVRVWSLPEGTAVRELTGHKDTITHLAANQASELVASAGRDGMIRIWNYLSGGLVHAIENPGSPVTALALHPNDQVLIGGHNSGEISFWSITTGRKIERLNVHRHPVTGLALTPDGNILYSSDSGGNLNSLKVWDLNAFLMVRLPGEITRPGSIDDLQARIQSPNSPAESAWLVFALELARWRQRFDIEIADYEAIHIGEFDIEL